MNLRVRNPPAPFFFEDCFHQGIPLPARRKAWAVFERSFHLVFWGYTTAWPHWLSGFLKKNSGIIVAGLK